MSLFEAGMMFCFGISWPFAVYKTWRAKCCHGKSFVFMWMVLLGYCFGIAHKLLISHDWVIWLYIFNGSMVLLDIIISYYYLDKAAPNA